MSRGKAGVKEGRTGENSWHEIKSAGSILLLHVTNPALFLLSFIILYL